MASAANHLPASRVARSDARGTRYRLRTRIAVFVHREGLDASLARGVDPATSHQLALRARRITRDSHRRALARSFEKALAAAARPGPRLSAAVPLADRDIYDARAALIDLCHALREIPTVNPAGVALAQQLLTDGRGPMYLASRDDALWHALRSATLALEAA
jgi:hypothetical protein